MRYYLVLKADAGSVPCSTTRIPHKKPWSQQPLQGFFRLAPVAKYSDGRPSTAAHFAPYRQLSDIGKFAVGPFPTPAPRAITMAAQPSGIAE